MLFFGGLGLDVFHFSSTTQVHRPAHVWRLDVFMLITQGGDRQGLEHQCRAGAGLGFGGFFLGGPRWTPWKRLLASGL